MKKISLTLIAVLLQLTINAQVSVWDGTSEPWINGSGTQNDPFLIENAQQLAYLAEKTNESIYDGVHYRKMYADTCFLLTIDLDLGADEGLEWEPVASNGRHNMEKGIFAGHFDGGGHSISNVTISNQTANWFGVFGYIEDGSLKNILVDGDEIRIAQIYSYAYGSSGLVLGHGVNVTIDNCVNKADVVWENITMDLGGCHLGGLFGAVENSTITDCHNYGNITAPNLNVPYNCAFCGGIVGWLKNCVVSDCSNYGDITVSKGEWFDVHYATCGGIAGMMTGTIANCSNNGEIFCDVAVAGSEDVKSAGGIIGYTTSGFGDRLVVENCYSISDISVVGDVNPAWAGGIIGYIADTIAASVGNCYFVSSGMLSDNVGGVVAKANANTAVENSYYVNTIPSGNDYGVPKTESEMQSQDFVNILNNGSNIYSMDDNHVNGGFPVFAKYYSAVENYADEVVSVYPNPSRGVINLSVAESVECHSAEIFSTDGRLVKSQTGDFESIDISGLNAGIYLLKLRLSDGTELTERIVKE